jgi:hypothetical protein
MSISIVAVTFSAISLTTIGTRPEGTWCAHLAVPPGAVSCSFYSLQRCQATVSGIGGFCTPNAFATYGRAREPRRRYRRNYLKKHPSTAASMVSSQVLLLPTAIFRQFFLQMRKLGNPSGQQAPSRQPGFGAAQKAHEPRPLTQRKASTAGMTSSIDLTRAVSSPPGVCTMNPCSPDEHGLKTIRTQADDGQDVAVACEKQKFMALLLLG